MTKDVLLTISGSQMMRLEETGEEREPIEIITPAVYYWKNGKHYLLYDEVEEGIPGVIKNKVKITGHTSLEIIKSGITNTHMVFEKDKMNVTYYETPYGQMQVGVHTRRIDVDESEEKIHVEVAYALDIDNEPFADCFISMDVRPKSMAELLQIERIKNA